MNIFHLIVVDLCDDFVVSINFYISLHSVLFLDFFHGFIHENINLRVKNCERSNVMLQETGKNDQE